MTATGELDLATAPRLEEVLDGVCARGAVVIVDLRRLDFIDVSGAHALIRSDRRIAQQGGRMVVIRGATTVTSAFGLMALDHRLDVVERPPDVHPTAGPAQAELAGDGLRRQRPDAARASLMTSGRALEAARCERDELRARVRCLEVELLDLVHQPPTGSDPPTLVDVRPA